MARFIPGRSVNTSRPLLLLLPLPTLLSTPTSLRALPLFALLDPLTDVVCSASSLADCYQPFRSLCTPKSSRSDALNSIDATTISRLTAPYSAYEALYLSPIPRISSCIKRALWLAHSLASRAPFLCFRRQAKNQRAPCFHVSCAARRLKTWALSAHQPPRVVKT